MKLESTTLISVSRAFVTFGDLTEEAGKKLESELAPWVLIHSAAVVLADIPFIRHALFVRCNVTKWNDQYEMFKLAKDKSPSKTIDVVVANAGITGADPIFYGEGEQMPPDEQSHY